MNLTRTQAIKIYLEKVTHPDLAALYNANMECQVNVGQDGGERVVGEFHGRAWNGWTDGQTTWKSFRIPRNANKNPEYIDTSMAFSLDHAEAIGMTGWDWQHRVSKWVAYDFDAISGHKDKHAAKLNDEELQKVVEAASGIEWVTVRKSASGKGLHLYVFLNEPTQNHNEHAALARAILSKMSALAGYDFQNKVDICGQNMWVYHRSKMGPNRDGLSLVKQGGTLTDIPQNWRDHINVVKGEQKRNIPKFIEQIEGQTDAERMFLELMGQMTRTPLDEQHKKLINYLEEKKTQSYWDTDHHMLISHTFYLKEAHEVLGFRGIFDSDAKGTDAPNDLNCFLSPLRNGGWVVRRYSMGCQEHASWDQDGRGYTRCYYNKEPDLATASRAKGGVEKTTGGFIFKEAEIALAVARSIGATVPEVPVGLRTRRTVLKKHRDGRLVVEIEGDPERVLETEMSGWSNEKGIWKRIFNASTTSPTEVETPSLDDMVRHVVMESGEEYGWMLKSSEGEWHKKDIMHIKIVLESMNLQRNDITGILGSAVQKAWKMVSRPFQPEYIGDRLWNRGAAQLRFVPTQDEVLRYPTWQNVLQHCGQGLDAALSTHPWAKANGIVSGAEYLKIWLSSLIKEPMEPLPYLFFYGDQNAGKSIFHEAVSLLFTRGYQRADVALINPQGFNQELEHAVLCVIEEIDLRRNLVAANRIKDWVTARQLPIHKKGKTPYHVTNCTHWCQMANDATACPTFPGDTRITMMYVQELEHEKRIPKRIMLDMLEKEAADFLGALKVLEIPPSNDRLNVPMIATVEKMDVENSNRTPVQKFLDEKCYYAPGQMISVSDFYQAFTIFIDPDDIPFWGKRKVGESLPPQYPKGRLPQNGHFYIGNISFDRPTPEILNRPKLRAITDEKKQIFLVTEGGTK